MIIVTPENIKDVIPAVKKTKVFYIPECFYKPDITERSLLYAYTTETDCTKSFPYHKACKITVEYDRD